MAMNKTGAISFLRAIVGVRSYWMQNIKYADKYVMLGDYKVRWKSDVGT